MVWLSSFSNLLAPQPASAQESHRDSFLESPLPVTATLPVSGPPTKRESPGGGLRPPSHTSRSHYPAIQHAQAGEHPFAPARSELCPHPPYLRSFLPLDLHSLTPRKWLSLAAGPPALLHIQLATASTRPVEQPSSSMESPTLHPEPGTAHLYTFESCSGLGALTVAAEGVIGRCSDHGTPAHLLPAPGGESFELLFNPGASAFYLDLKRGLAEPGNPVWGYARTTPEKRQAWVLYVWVAGVGKGDLLPFSVAMAGASPHLGGAAALVSPSHAAALARLSSAQGHWCLLFQSAVEGSLVLAVAEDGNALCVSEYDEGGVPTPHQLWRAERVSDTEGLPAAVPSARTLERYLERHAATDSITHKDNCDIRSFSIENDYRLLKLYSDAATSASAPLGLSELPLPDGMPLIVDLNVTAQLEEGGEVPSQRLWAPSSGSSLKQVYDLCRALRSAYAQVLDIPDKRPMHFTVLLRNNGYLDGHEWRDGIHIQCKELWAPAWIHRFVRERFHRDCAFWDCPGGKVAGGQQRSS